MKQFSQPGYFCQW